MKGKILYIMAEKNIIEKNAKSLTAIYVEKYETSDNRVLPCNVIYVLYDNNEVGVFKADDEISPLTEEQARAMLRDKYEKSNHAV